MSDKVKNLAVTFSFILFVAFFSVMCVVRYFNPTATSESERRPLAQFPDKITWEGVIDKTVIDDFEDYTTSKLLLAFERYNALHIDGVVDATIEVWHNDTTKQVFAEVIW